LIACNSAYYGLSVEQQYGPQEESIIWQICGAQGGNPPLSGYPLMLGRNGTIGDSTRFQGQTDFPFEYFGENNNP
jgi:hypothetical protein